MPRIALWTFDDAPGSTVAQDTHTDDGTAQNGVYHNGATTTGNGAGVFDGVDDYVEIPDDPAFHLASGSIAITFTQETASVSGQPVQTLFSRDSNGYDGGGHLTI